MCIPCVMCGACCDNDVQDGRCPECGNEVEDGLLCCPHCHTILRMGSKAAESEAFSDSD